MTCAAFFSYYSMSNYNHIIRKRYFHPVERRDRGDKIVEAIITRKDMM